MSPAIRALAWQVRGDLTLQWRHGFAAAYAVVIATYLALFSVAPPPAAKVLLPLVLGADTTVLGFFFVGGLVLLERADHSLKAVSVTPLSTAAYLGSKVVSLGALSLAASLGLALLSGHGHHPVQLLLAVALICPLFVLLGVIVVSRTPTVNRYMVYAGVFTGPLMLPLAEPLGLPGAALWDWTPAGAALDLLVGATTDGIDAPTALRAGFVLAVGHAIAWPWAARWFDRHVAGRADA
ncbi:MAG: hypothetical protein H6733_15445 [Alphaproteobacteria bacterium]|nr:hypothetical protein [Alphaproteobacteria bacterium]